MLEGDQTGMHLVPSISVTDHYCRSLGLGNRPPSCCTAAELPAPWVACAPCPALPKPRRQRQRSQHVASPVPPSLSSLPPPPPTALPTAPAGQTRRYKQTSRQGVVAPCFATAFMAVRPAMYPEHQLLTPPAPQLRFPPSLSARQRAAVHAVGERWGLPHSSCGEGAARHIILGPEGAQHTIHLGLPAAGEGGGGGVGSSSTDGTCSSSEPTDAQLTALIQQHLGIDASDAFAAGPPPGGQKAAAARPPAAWQGGAKAGKAQPGAKGLVSVDEFIAKVLPLLEMEREAEVAQVRGWQVPACLFVG